MVEHTSIREGEPLGAAERGFSMSRQTISFLTWLAVAGGMAGTDRADGPSIPITPKRTDVGRIKVAVGLDDRRHTTIVVYNQENTNEQPSVRAWLVISDSSNQYVAGVEVAGKAFHDMKNAINYRFALSPEYRVNTTFHLSLPKKGHEPGAPVYEVLLGEFERARIQARRKGDRAE